MSSSTACDAHRRRCRAQLVWGEDDVEEKKQEILQAVKRDNPEEKLKDFWLRTDELIAVLRHQFRLRKLPHKLARSGGWCGFLLGTIIQGLARGHLVLYWTSTVSAFVLNFIMLFVIVSENVDEHHSISARPELGVPAVSRGRSLHTITYRCIPLHAVAYRHVPL